MAYRQVRAPIGRVPSPTMDGEGMARRLGRVCKEAREQAGLTMMMVAITAGVHESVLSDFENRTGWRRRTDQIVAAYERECGLEPGELWRRAVGC